MSAINPSVKRGIVGTKERERKTSTADFPTWFNTGYYGGLLCCICSIAVSALYTSLCRRGMRRQVMKVSVVCVISAVLLSPAIIWFTLRFHVKPAVISGGESVVVLCYVALFGWILPLAVTGFYFLFVRSSTSITPPSQPHQKRIAAPSAAALHPPRYQADIQTPFVFNDDAPWGWLEYRTGNFQGQRLALKRVIALIGRDENCDIWLDDDMASRHHAELAWDNGRVCLTDCGSLNGVSLNGRRVRGTVQVASNDLIVVGSHCFAFILSERQEEVSEASDPLAHHTWRSSLDLRSDIMPALPPTLQKPVEEENRDPSGGPVETYEQQWKEMAQQEFAASLAGPVGGLLMHDSEMAGQRFVLDRPVMTVGRGAECDIVINDVSISRQHVQFLRQLDGDYVRDLDSHNGTLLNGELLHSAHLLKFKDIICLGNIHLEYISVQTMQIPPSLQESTPPPQSFGRPSSGPMPLKLPSKTKG